MKKIWFFIVLMGLFLASHSQTPIKPSVVKINYKSSTTRLFKQIAYTVCFDTVLNVPIYVSHAISKKIIEAGDISRDRPKSPSYPMNPQYNRLKNDAFEGSGYDHGHLAPCRDFKWNEDAWYESFYMTNMSPQNACCNQRGWCYLESLCRYWAKSSNNETIYIVSGIIPGNYIDSLCISSKMKVFVPACYYKVVLSYNSKTKSAKGIGFIISNSDVNNDLAVNSQCTIDEVESVTDLDFFSFLPDKIEKTVESQIGFNDFNCKSECPDKSCSTIYEKRTQPENRAKLLCK